MEKDITIKEFLDRLKLTINFSLLEVVDYWEADLCAIGLKKGCRLVYISTYNYNAGTKMKYDFDLELLNESDPEKIELLKQGRGVSEDILKEEIRQFLQV